MRISRMGTQILLLLLFTLSHHQQCQAMEFDMVFQTKCLYEDVGPEEEILIKYDSHNKDDPSRGEPLTVRIEDPNGNSIYERKDSKSGSYKIDESLEGDYKICFTAIDYPTAQNTRVRYEFALGADAHDWEAVAKHDHLNDIQTEMQRLEALTHTIHVELQQIRKKEFELRDVNGTISEIRTGPT